MFRALLVSAVIAAVPPPPQPSVDPAVKIEKRHAECRVRIDALYARLLAALDREAPDLAAELRRQEPKPIRHGYGILPAIVPDAAPPPTPPKAKIVSYSWPRTASGLEEHAARIAALTADVDRAPSIDAALRRPVWEKAVRDWERIPKDQRSLDAHIQYNRLWQGEIAKNRTYYDRQTELLNSVIELQKIRDELAAGTSIENKPALIAREEMFSRRIHDSTDEIARSPFASLTTPSAHVSVINVAMYTDIKDDNFVEQFRKAVESAWDVRDGDERFRVALTIHRIPPAADGTNFANNVARFPAGAAILTTGVITTHVAEGRCIALGPHEIQPRVLAHEFGHILGFSDAYFRGYRELGADGFEVMEVVADPDDIMGASGTGTVKRRHFERLVEVLRESDYGSNE